MFVLWRYKLVDGTTGCGMPVTVYHDGAWRTQEYVRQLPDDRSPGLVVHWRSGVPLARLSRFSMDPAADVLLSLKLAGVRYPASAPVINVIPQRVM